LTNHFINWLNDVGGYEPYNFNRSDFFGGSFGGKDNDNTPIKRRPVIFVHGTGGRLIGDNPITDGFRYTIEYFLSKGYTKAELYGSMWGFGDVDHMFEHYH
jgi:triacylglycerol lipase